MTKQLKSIRLSEESINYILSQNGCNFSQSLEKLIEKSKLQDEFFDEMSKKNNFIRVAKTNKNTLEASIRVLKKNNNIIKKSLEHTEQILSLHKLRKEVDDYNDKVNRIYQNSRKHGHTSNQ